MRSFDDLVRAGKVRHVGRSNAPAWYAARAQTIAEWRGYEKIAAFQLEHSLVERSIEAEPLAFGMAHGISTMVWSPLGSGLLSGKYRPSQGGTSGTGSGRLETLKGSGKAGFEQFNDRNWAIVAELADVAKRAGRSMAQVALNWVAHRPGIASVIVGATKPEQLEDNLAALDFALPAELTARLDAVGASAPRYPYSFFTPGMQVMLTGGAAVGDKPAGYAPPRVIAARPAGVQAR